MELFLIGRRPSGKTGKKWPEDFEVNREAKSFQLYTTDKSKSTTLTWDENDERWYNHDKSLAYY